MCHHRCDSRHCLSRFSKTFLIGRTILAAEAVHNGRDGFPAPVLLLCHLLYCLTRSNLSAVMFSRWGRRGTRMDEMVRKYGADTETQLFLYHFRFLIIYRNSFFQDTPRQRYLSENTEIRDPMGATSMELNSNHELKYRSGKSSKG